MPIVKVEKDEADPSVRYVYGCATNGQVDTDRQIVDPEFARKAMATWYATGANVRQMHATTLPPAGKGVLLEDHGDDGQYVRTKVVEPTAVRLVDEGVYTGYSVGIAQPRIVRDAKAPGGRIADGVIVELSLVDRPALPTAKFAVLKAARAGSALRFIGKSVSAAPRPPRIPAKGTVVTVMAHDEDGEVRSHTGRIITKGVGSIALSTAGFSQSGAVKRLHVEDIESIAIGKGHDHAHDYQHHSDVSVEVHNHPEGSVADDKQQPDTQVSAAPPADVDTDGQQTAADGSSDDGDADADDTLRKEAKCSKCKGSGFRAEGVKCKKCKGTGLFGDAPVAKGATVEEREGQFVVLKGEAVLGTHADKAAADSQRDAVNGAEAEAKKAAKAQKTAKAEARKAAKQAKKAAKAAKAGTAKAAAGEVPFLLKRAHDYTCGAYEVGAVDTVYPHIGKGSGMAGSIDPSLAEAIRAALAAEAAGVAGGLRANGLAGLAKASAALDDLLADAKVSDDLPGARAAISKSFLDVNPDAKPKDNLPSPSESVKPGQFRRGYISAGHQDEKASAHSADIPTTTHPVRASDYDRGALTDGHQRYIASKLADLHDGLADWRPDICLMDSGGSMAFDRQPAQSFERDPFRAKQVPSGDTSAPTAAVIPDSRRAPGEKGSVPEVVVPASQPVAAAVTTAQIEEALTKALAPHLAKIQSLEATVESLSATPDPAQRAFRGAIAAPGSTKAATVGTGKASREAKRSKKADKVAFLRSIVQSGDPGARLRAQDRLDRMGAAES